MAANLQNRGLASFRKILATQICTPDSLLAPFISLRKGVHVSAYDKNVEEVDSHSSVVPDHVIPPQPENYWAPHPRTGVFGPATTSDQNLAPGGDINLSESSVLEQKAFFRAIEDLEKPTVQP